MDRTVGRGKEVHVLSVLLSGQESHHKQGVDQREIGRVDKKVDKRVDKTLMCYQWCYLDRRVD